MAIEGVRKSEFFFLSWKERKDVGVAFAPEEAPLRHELVPLLEGKDELPFMLQIKSVHERDEGINMQESPSLFTNITVDFQPNSLALPMMSEGMKNVIGELLTGQEGISWVKAKIKASNKIIFYYIPRFSKKLDVLDLGKTVFVPGTDIIIKPCFSLKKVSSFNMFHDADNLFWEITSSIYVSGRVKDAIQKAKLTGVSFEKASVS